MGFGNAQTGQHSQNGTSEQYVGRALRALARREDVVAATKFTPRSKEEIGLGVTGQQHIAKRLEEDSYAKGKYDATAEQDGKIIARVAELTAEETAYLEEPYIPHQLVGVMAQNRP